MVRGNKPRSHDDKYCITRMAFALGLAFGWFNDVLSAELAAGKGSETLARLLGYVWLYVQGI